MVGRNILHARRFASSLILGVYMLYASLESTKGGLLRILSWIHSLKAKSPRSWNRSLYAGYDFAKICFNSVTSISASWQQRRKGEKWMKTFLRAVAVWVGSNAVDREPMVWAHWRICSAPLLDNRGSYGKLFGRTGWAVGSSRRAWSILWPCRKKKSSVMFQDRVG